MLTHSGVGLTWVLDEPLARASHALADDGVMWLIDPTDEPAALEAALALGRPAAVLQLLDRHNRDCARVAERLAVPHVKVPAVVPDSPFEVVPLVGWRFWHEVALWWPARRALAVAEAIGTSPGYAPASLGAGVSVGLRPWPPRRLAAYEPEHVLVGHGPPLHGSAAAPALREALRRSRVDLPRAVVALPLAMAGGRSRRST
jgi:hypothetical protein